MDNNLLISYRFSMAFMLAMLILLLYQVFMVHDPIINKLQETKSVTESFGNAMDVYGQKARYLSEQSDTLLAMPGYNKSFVMPDEQTADTFFGGSEPPVFYDIGNVRDARAMRGKENAPSGDYYKNSNGDLVLCPPGQRTSVDGLSCYTPEGMADPLAITTSGFRTRGIEDELY